MTINYVKVSDLLKTDMTYVAIALECECSYASVRSFANLPADQRRRLVARSKKSAG